MKRLMTALTGLALVASLAGCKVGPNYKRPIVDTPASYRGGLAPDITATPTTTPLGAQKWDTVFTDPILQALIAEALKNNYDVKIAADRVLEQQAQVGITRAGEYPTLSAGASYDAIGLPSSLLNGLNNNSSSNNGSSNSNSNTSSRYYSGGFTASVAWNLDFWGMYRRQTEAARANLRATEWAQQTTYSSLVESIATDYYQLRTLDSQLEITKQTLKARQDSLKLTQTLEQGGNTSLVDVRQAEQLLYTAQSQIPDLERQIEQMENNINLLLGRSPGPIARGQSINELTHPVDVPVGLPSDLLERRPDIRRAEQLLVEANANIGVAKAQFFPALSITGSGGTSSSQLKGLVDSKNAYYYAIGSLSQPIFDAGKIRNNYRQAQAEHKELLDTYQQTIAGALRDVSNALSAYSRTREYREQQELLVASATDASKLSRIRYNGGATSYLEVLTDDTNLYTAQLNLQTAQQQEALSLVQLYNALGGGW